ncbi:MAG TPA: LytTR family DNA-binding domain-containing protein [Bacteroidota bacterium]
MDLAIRTMVVDDEALGRRKILRLLADDPEVECLGDYEGGEEAVDAIRAQKPDLLFLDIRMPLLDGFAILRDTAAACTPTVIFVTAYGDHAIHAFEVHAFDYLLKPFDRSRFCEALSRAKDQVRLRREADRREKSSQGPDGIAPEAAAQEAVSTRNCLMVKCNGRITFLRAEEIDWIEAERDYVCLHTASRKCLVREKIGELETAFAPEHFVRIHRSVIVALNRIKELRPLLYGEYAVILHDGTQLTLSRSYREKVFHRLMQTPC